MKSFNKTALALGLFMAILPGKTFAAKDPAVCGQIGQALEVQKERFEEFEAGANSADEICGEDSDPKACVAAIKSEYSTAKGELKTVQSKKATACAN